MNLDIPKWQKDLIDIRLAEYKAAPQNTREWDEVSKELDIEDVA